MWSIDKQFSFCYGHRVYVQRLNTEFTAEGDTACKCRHHHGHEGLVHVFLEADKLDDRSMVVDFKELGWFKDFVDTYLDHKYIIDYNDPMFHHMVMDTYCKAHELEHNIYSKQWFIENKLVDVVVDGCQNVTGGKIVDMTSLKKNTPEFEVLEGFFVVDFVPTSENLSAWIYKVVESKMSQLNVKTKEIWWFETPKSRSIYRG